MVRFNWENSKGYTEKKSYSLKSNRGIARAIHFSTSEKILWVIHLQILNGWEENAWQQPSLHASRSFFPPLAFQICLWVLVSKLSCPEELSSWPGCQRWAALLCFVPDLNQWDFRQVYLLCTTTFKRSLEKKRKKQLPHNGSLRISRRQPTCNYKRKDQYND